MSIRTTLMLMAATVAAPLSAQQPAEVYTTLTTATTANATAEQRAAAMPALAALPADCEACYAITNIPGVLANLHKLGVISQEDMLSMPDEVKALNSFAIGMGNGGAATINAVIRLYNCLSATDMLPVLNTVPMTAAEEYASILKQEYDKAVASVNSEITAVLSSVKLAPIYTVLAVNSGYEGMLEEWYNLLQETLNEAPAEEGFEIVSVNGYNGIKFTLSKEDAEPTEWDSEAEAAIKQALSERSIYVLFKLEGTKIISVVCENTDELKTVTSVQESILGTDKLAKLDDKLNMGITVLSYSSPAFTNAYNSETHGDLLKVAQTVENMFTALAAKGDANSATFAAASKASNTIINAWNTLTVHTMDRPCVGALSWGNGVIDIDMYCDNCGFTYAPAKLSLLNKAADPNTIFYLESSYLKGYNLPTTEAMLDAGLAVIDGVVATATPETQASATASLAMAKAFLPELKQAVQAVSTIGSGLDNTCAVIVDKNATLPTLLGGKDGNTTAFPRVAFYSGVSDRAKLSEGWDSLLDVAGNVAKKAGQNPDLVNMLPIVPKMVGKATSYSVSMPWFTENLVPNLTVSDTAFVVGSSAKLNAELAETATGTVDVNGCVCTLKFAPLASMLRSIADDLTAQAEAQAPAEEETAVEEEEETPVVVISDEEEEEWDEEYVDEDDFDEEEIYSYHYRNQSPAQERAENFEDAAEALETVAEYADSLNFTYTTDEEELRIHIQVKLNK